MIESFEQIRQKARSQGGVRLAVVVPHDLLTLEVATHARVAGLADSILIGDEATIRTGLEQLSQPPLEFEIIHQPVAAAAATVGVTLVLKGSADVILKGQLPTQTLLTAVLHPEHGLRTGDLLSDVRLNDHPTKAKGLLAITDGGVTPTPSLDQKRIIVRNAVALFHRLGYAEPKVALLAATEHVTPQLPHTREARKVAEEASLGRLGACAADGPLSLDLALQPQAVSRKEYRSVLGGAAATVAGRADILVAPGIETANSLAKLLRMLGNRPAGQVIVGAQAPVVIASRADDPEVKLNSIALAAIMARSGQ